MLEYRVGLLIILFICLGAPGTYAQSCVSTNNNTIINFYFRVFNRWGQLIFSTAKLNDGWDGRVSGGEQPPGTYVWMVQGVARDGKVITKKGTVTLIR